MRRAGRVLAVGMLATGIAACDQSRPAAIAGCAYRAIPIAVDDDEPDLKPPQATPAPLTADDKFATELRSLVVEAPAPQPTPGATPAPSPTPAPPQFLVLSGGSQHGAFGAGFFYGLQSIPTYDMVTGVSTGSLQSTMLFLANTPPPKDRTYAWVDGPLASEIKPGTSNAGDLALAYSIAKEGDIITPASGGILGGLSMGALATFEPLKARLKAVISPDTLRQVAAEAAKGRKLYVGVVNLDDGKGYAVDLTDLASRVDTPTWKDQTGKLQDCYVEALAASSSVPPSAYPVSLEIAEGNGTRTSMYMDGGARFGVFLEQIIRALGEDAPDDARVTVIVNGVLYGGPWTADGKPVDKWSAATVAARAVSLLETQVYRFSVASAEQFGIDRGGLNMAFISNQGLPPGAEEPMNHVFRGKTCTAWNDIDNQAKPLQFHPNYMACLSDYGRSRGAAGLWNRQVDAPQGAAPTP